MGTVPYNLNDEESDNNLNDEFDSMASRITGREGQSMDFTVDDNINLDARKLLDRDRDLLEFVPMEGEDCYALPLPLCKIIRQALLLSIGKFNSTSSS